MIPKKIKEIEGEIEFNNELEMEFKKGKEEARKEILELIDEIYKEHGENMFIWVDKEELKQKLLGGKE